MTGLRSSLRDYNQDGVLDATGDPFGTTFAGADFVLGPPTNDNFKSAQAVSGTSFTVSGSNINATAEPNETAHVTDDSQANASVWYAWKAPVTGSYTLNTIGSSFNTELAVYTGTDISTLTTIVQNDDISNFNQASQKCPAQCHCRNYLPFRRRGL